MSTNPASYFFFFSLLIFRFLTKLARLNTSSILLSNRTAQLKVAELFFFLPSFKVYNIFFEMLNYISNNVQKITPFIRFLTFVCCVFFNLLLGAACMQKLAIWNVTPLIWAFGRE